LFTPLALIFGAEGGHHDNLNVFCLCRRAEDVEHVKATDFWHHDVTDDELRPFFNGHSKRFFAVTSGYDVVPLCQ
jgi:hypothetical protein